MAITGNIKTFYLSSLLQLLSNDKKTGILELTDGSDIVQVFFRDGTIINAFGSSRVERLTNYLRSEGIVSAEQLDKGLNMSAHTGKKIGKVLVEQGLISQELLESLLHRQIEQTLFSLFLWEQGEFEYRDQEFDLSDQIVTSFDTMGVVLEASRRVDEIPQLKQRVPQDNEIPAITANSEALQKATLHTAERAVLSLINGKRAVKRVIEDSGYDELKVYKTLFSLVTAGLIIREKNTLKRPPASVHKEISERKLSVAAAADQVIAPSSQGPDSTRPVPGPAQQSGQTPESLFAAPASEQSGQTPESLFADPTANRFEQTPQSLFAAPEDTRAHKAELPPEPNDMVLELEPKTTTAARPGAPDSNTPEDRWLSEEIPPAGQTVIKIDGEYLAGIDFSDIEPVGRPKLQPVDKNEVAEALRAYGDEGNLDDYDNELKQARQRMVKKAIACVAAVFVIAVAGLLLKPVLFPDEPAPEPAVETPRIVKKKVPKKDPQAVEKPAAVAQPGSGGHPEPAADEEAVVDLFLDHKGWISINLPPGYSISEQPLEDRTSVLISYGTDITLSLSVVPESAVWNAEDEMYASIVKMQGSGSRHVQKYAVLKHAGCPGYTLHFTSERDQKSVQTAIYRFVCFNKSVRLEVNNSSWRTDAGRKLGERIHAAIESSFLIYQ